MRERLQKSSFLAVDKARFFEYNATLGSSQTYDTTGRCVISRNIVTLIVNEGLVSERSATLFSSKTHGFGYSNNY